MERYLPVNLLGPGPRLMKKNLPARGLTKVEKRWPRTAVLKLCCADLKVSATGSQGIPGYASEIATLKFTNFLKLQ